eukprot:ctg_1306.g462
MDTGRRWRHRQGYGEATAVGRYSIAASVAVDRALPGGAGSDPSPGRHRRRRRRRSCQGCAVMLEWTPATPVVVARKHGGVTEPAARASGVGVASWLAAGGGRLLGWSRVNRARSISTVDPAAYRWDPVVPAITPFLPPPPPFIPSHSASAHNAGIHSTPAPTLPLPQLIIYTAPKPTRDRHEARAQMRALQSWTRLQPPPFIVLFGNGNDADDAQLESIQLSGRTAVPLHVPAGAAGRADFRPTDARAAQPLAHRVAAGECRYRAADRSARGAGHRAAAVCRFPGHRSALGRAGATARHAAFVRRYRLVRLAVRAARPPVLVQHHDAAVRVRPRQIRQLAVARGARRWLPPRRHRPQRSRRRHARTARIRACGARGRRLAAYRTRQLLEHPQAARLGVVSERASGAGVRQLPQPNGHAAPRALQTGAVSGARLLCGGAAPAGRLPLRVQQFRARITDRPAAARPALVALRSGEHRTARRLPHSAARALGAHPGCAAAGGGGCDHAHRGDDRRQLRLPLPADELGVQFAARRGAQRAGGRHGRQSVSVRVCTRTGGVLQ